MPRIKPAENRIRVRWVRTEKQEYYLCAMQTASERKRFIDYCTSLQVFHLIDSNRPLDNDWLFDSQLSFRLDLFSNLIFGFVLKSLTSE